MLNVVGCRLRALSSSSCWWMGARLCLCLKRRQSPFRFVNNIIFHVRSIICLLVLLVLVLVLPDIMLARRNLFSICHFTTKPNTRLVFVSVRSHPFVRPFRLHVRNVYIVPWRTAFIVFVCEFVNYLTENSFQFSLPHFAVSHLPGSLFFGNFVYVATARAPKHTTQSTFHAPLCITLAIF